ncbi:TetR family transcriptional regulator [Rhodanobacter panaciterrae]|uniref:TetR family transcriptional regulator n=1 Tax=Rhodanobacter panaciterrae TaxID=490572 RepID=A0ABQ2ZLC3_9GAMM|nr:TetR/AcrR family transcriptional regulator [Rhodanobacter panaciterrae]GGY19113.1 TetR family transcriptional regulator [Rhodanobacter panaciterrae]
MQTRKEILTDELVDYLLEHGLSDLSLRPLADALGTSARLLIYHFESKEGLLTEVLDSMQTRLRQSFGSLVERRAGQSERPLKMFWDWAITDENYPYFKLLYELQILAVQNPAVYGSYLQRNASNWSELIATALPEAERTPAMVTLLGAVFDGLFLELMSTGDRKRTTQAVLQFIQLVDEARAARPASKKKTAKASSTRRG